MSEGASIPACPACGHGMTPVMNDGAPPGTNPQGPLSADPPFRYVCKNPGCAGAGVR
jgi:hypothetical protein